LGRGKEWLELESWRDGELENWRTGELENWRKILEMFFDAS